MKQTIDESFETPYTVFYSNSVFAVLCAVARQFNVGYNQVSCRGGQVLVDGNEIGEIRPEEEGFDWEIEL
jgi:hypothetical protein